MESKGSSENKRLVKLFDLVESTSTTYGVKKLATNQIFQIYTHNHSNLELICQHILTSIQNKSWETRQVTANLIDQLAQEVAEFSPPLSQPGADPSCQDQFTFASVDLELIVQRGKPLLSCAGNEFDLDLDGMSQAERVAFQRKQLKERLGFAEAFGSGTNDFVEDEDLIQIDSARSSSSDQLIDMSQLSARERVQLKRKMKKMKTTDTKRKNSNSSLPTETKNEEVRVDVENPILKQWPFYPLCESMLHNLFNPNWHVRQGACMGLKAFCKSRLLEFSNWYGIAGKCAGEASSSLGPIEDLLVRLNCLLALDRFADFVETQAIVVVRESCGQLIATICHLLLENVEMVSQEISQLTILIQPSMDWQIRLSGLVGLKYLSSVLPDATWVKEDLKANLLNCLSSDDEDVRSLACDIFIQLSLKKTFEQKQQDEEIFSLLIKHLDQVFSCEEYELADVITSNSLTYSIQLISNYWNIFGNDQVFWSILKFIRHPTQSIRQACLEIISKCLQIENDLLTKYLAEFVILEENYSLKHEACRYLAVRKVTLDNLINFIFPILFTPLVIPFQRSQFSSVASFSLDLYFKNSDMLIHSEDFLRTSRTLLCMHLKKIENLDESLIDLYKTFEQRISILLILLASDSKLLSLVEQLTNRDYSVELGKEERLIAALECCYLYSIQKTLTPSHIKILLNELKEEGVEVLQEIIASTIAQWIITSGSRKLISLVASLFSSNLILCPDLNVDPKVCIYSLQSSLFTEQIPIIDIPSRGADMVIKAISNSNSFILFPLIDDLYFKNESNMSSLLIGIVTCGSLLKHSKVNQLECLKKISQFLQNTNPVIRYCTCSTFSNIPLDQFGFIIENLLGKVEDPHFTAGIVELIYQLVKRDIFVRSPSALPFVLFFIAPILKCLNHSNSNIRNCSYQSFSSLLALVTLFNFKLASNDPFEGQKFTDGSTFLQRAIVEHSFLEQLFDLKLIAQDPLQVPSCLKVSLRPYQEEGIKWLRFLHKYNLNGALCDDMGLGKTIQTLVAIFLSTQSCSFGSTHPSLIVCPATLVGHWENEILVHFKKNLLPIVYTGSVVERRRKRKGLQSGTLPTGTVLVTSYDVLRNDTELFSSFQFDYCVLDEGHLIKNAKTKISQAVRQIQSKHRLLLSGTPIQNNVLELWALFDFLMPGFLGSESWFNAKYCKAIQSSKDAKTMSAEFEAAEKALSLLHKQTLPFILRRLKEDVLKDLPPKIIQDYPIEMTAIQRKLYLKYSNKVIEEEEEGGQKGKIFRTIQFLARISLHPSLIFETIKQYEEYLSEEGEKNEDFLAASPKLLALKEILQDSNVQIPIEGLDEEPHKLLIFAQHKSTLDIIEKYVLKDHFPSLPFLRLDGSISSESRFKIALQFNNDPSIRVILLTTHIGGLGLNLIGGDRVIFFEHDWNPQKDLQAMDRAHRLGQKRIVNVYRLIMKDSIEERIMGSQKFKLYIAGSIINQQNVAISSMCSNDGEGEDDKLDVTELFCLSTQQQPTSEGKKKEKEKSTFSFKDFLQQAENESMVQDDDEKGDDHEQYDMKSFVDFLKTEK